VIGTAHWIAAARARESARQDALFRDSYAAARAGERGRTLLARSEAASGGEENVSLPIRTRYFDDALREVTGRIPQVVLLGAGFDTRAFRLPPPQAVTVYEISRAEIGVAAGSPEGGVAGILEQVDRLLYRAKRTHNRVAAAAESK
jgi:methyltransferase (TIGR00027 family)